MGWWHIAGAVVLGMIVGAYATIWGLIAVKNDKVKKAKALAGGEGE